jgi:hypothetical protein
VRAASRQSACRASGHRMSRHACSRQRTACHRAAVPACEERNANVRDAALHVALWFNVGLRVDAVIAVWLGSLPEERRVEPDAHDAGVAVRFEWRHGRQCRPNVRHKLRVPEPSRGMCHAACSIHVARDKLGAAASTGSVALLCHAKYREHRKHCAATPAMLAGCLTTHRMTQP